MDNFILVIQLVVALGILNVWIIRFGKSTDFRGGDAKNLRDEFSVYGLPTWMFYLIGALKLSFASLLLAGIWWPSLVVPAAIGMAALMLGAILMHVKVKDPVMKVLPATLMLLMSATIAIGS